MYLKSRILHTCLLIAVGIGALTTTLLLYPDAQAFVPWAGFVVYLVCVFLSHFSYELSLWHNMWHNAWHARETESDEPSDFSVIGGRIVAYIVMIIALCVLLFVHPV